jgi:hypothetical protein
MMVQDPLPAEEQVPQRLDDLVQRPTRLDVVRTVRARQMSGSVVGSWLPHLSDVVVLHVLCFRRPCYSRSRLSSL